MATKLIITFLLIVLGSSMLSGCVSGNQTAPSPFYPTSSSIPRMPSPTLMPTPSPTDTPTFTNIPTLPKDQAFTRLSDLLSNNSCRLPCWLGITPGQSTLQDVQQQLDIFSSIDKLHYLAPAGEWSSGDLTIPYPNDSMEIEIHPGYLSSPITNTISVIEITTLSYRIKNGGRDVDIYDYPPYNQLMKAYTLSAVLSGYGLPDQIYFYALATSPLVYFQIHIWYPEKGIFMIYNLLAHDLGNSYQLCPTDALISGFLTQPGITDYQGFLLQTYNQLYSNFFPPTNFVKTTDEAFGTTTDQFYQLFRTPTTRCLETPKTVWPVVTGP